MNKNFDKSPKNAIFVKRILKIPQMETTSLIDCFLNKDKKKYRFDYLRDSVMEWHESVRENVTIQMLYNLPFNILAYNGLHDYYGEEIVSFECWKQQRDEYLDNLYNELKKNKLQ